MKYVNSTVVTAHSDVSSFNGSKIDSSQLFQASFQAFFSTVTFGGTVKIQASNDPCADGMAPSSFSPTHWSDVPNATVTVTAGSAGTHIIAKFDTSYRWLRVVVTQTTPGDGLVTVNMFGVSV